MVSGSLGPRLRDSLSSRPLFPGEELLPQPGSIPFQKLPWLRATMAGPLGYDLKPRTGSYTLGLPRGDRGMSDALKGHWDNRFSDKKYTDLVVKCKGREYNVHRIVVCSQCAFFDNACKPDSPFVEARTGVIDLSEDPPELVEVLLAYFYIQDIPLHENVRLKEGRKTRFFASVYAMAEKYRVAGLKLRAWAAFHDYLNAGEWQSPHFVKTIAFVWELTPEKDMGLRHAVLSAVAPQLHWFTSRYAPHFEEDMDALETFWDDLARYRKAFPDLERRFCPSCLSQVALEVRPAGLSKCPACGLEHSEAQWCEVQIWDVPAEMGTNWRNRVQEQDRAVVAAAAAAAAAT
ncbi:btb poz domain protein [Diplodia corticola]|uniref:Btb poz domain protein n=1 Tax=Diplodia corticola TaxID=236234 RepID=A0A1J9RV17_9PEZI|nr:btb poz domain protein [Diplodia corticola]OJD32263.1 btb poz domain protein [Diplodia corticola]